MLEQVHVYVIGDVIGVGYRAWLRSQAKRYFVTGWARNSHDKPEVFGNNGGVEAVLQGKDDDISALIEVMKKGPDISVVDNVLVYFQEPKELYESFEVRK